VGADGGQDARGLHDTKQAEQADRNEPHQHYRPEDAADELRSPALDHEQTGQDCDGDRNDHWRESGRVDLETFDSAEYRDRRRDHPVAVEQRSPDQTDDEQGGTPAPAWCAPRIQQREQGHDAALAVIIGAQDQNCVFERDDQEERPEDQRHDAHRCVGGGRPGRLDGLLQPIERAGADIAVDNTECGKRHGCGLLRDALPGQPRGVKGLGHPDFLPFGCASLHENGAGEKLGQWHDSALPAWSDFLAISRTLIG
jgi:hypothetical protein